MKLTKSSGPTYGKGVVREGFVYYTEIGTLRDSVTRCVETVVNSEHQTARTT